MSSLFVSGFCVQKKENLNAIKDTSNPNPYESHTSRKNNNLTILARAERKIE